MSFSSVPQDVRIVLTNEKVTGPPGQEMIRLLGIDDSSEVLDNATGGGVTALAAKAKYATDINESMVSLAASRGVNVLKADQANVPLDAGSFTHITNAFGVFFSPNDTAVLTETLRLLRANGKAGFISWKEISWWPEVYSAMPLPLPDPGSIFPGKWNEAQVIQEKMAQAGFADVKVTECKFTPLVDVQEFAEATAVLVKVIAKRAWSEDDFTKYSPEIEPKILEILRAKHGQVWKGSMTALITIGTKLE